MFAFDRSKEKKPALVSGEKEIEESAENRKVASAIVTLAGSTSSYYNGNNNNDNNKHLQLHQNHHK